MVCVALGVGAVVKRIGNIYAEADMNFHDALQAFHFIRPDWLIALPLVWSLSAWLMLKHARDGDWSHLIDPELLPGLRLKGQSGSGSASPWPWLCCAWTLAVVALAGPSWEQEEVPAYRAPAVWMVVLGLSPSMAATDLSPNRYTRARYAINDILDSARDARVGMVVYSDEAYTVSPLTDDVATVRALLPPMAPDIMPSAGDHLAPALLRAGTLLQQSGAKDKQLVLLADEFDDPAAALTAAAKLKAQGVTLNVVGVGTSGGAPIKGSGGQFSLDSKGQPQLARLNTDSLRQVAIAGGGRYVDLDGLSTLTTDLHSQPDRLAGATEEHGVHLSKWLDGGAWLLPGLLLLAAVLARRGWL
jgi:Ca-activated chloride channel family protein